MNGAMSGNVDVTTLLPLIWAAVIGTAVAFYVILDGFDIGIGILFPFARNAMPASDVIAPTGNSVGAITVRPSMSAATMMIAPASAVAGISRR